MFILFALIFFSDAFDVYGLNKKKILSHIDLQSSKPWLTAHRLTTDGWFRERQELERRGLKE